MPPDSGSLTHRILGEPPYKEKVAIRRAAIENVLNLELCPLTDDILKSLYQFACQIFLAKCHLRFEHSGFQKTPSERKLLETIHQVIQDHHEFKHVEIYPSVRHSKDFPPKLKMVIGCYVPDLIIFGLKKDGYSGAFIEVDGDSHIYKHRSDMKMYDRLEELGLFPLPIPNEKSTDYGYVLGVFQELSRSRSGALDEQIKRSKRVLWCKTIACNLSLEEIDGFVHANFDISLHMKKEAEALIKISSCPIKLKTELSKIV